jgi:hypothetical protein
VNLHCRLPRVYHYLTLVRKRPNIVHSNNFLSAAFAGAL